MYYMKADTNTIGKMCKSHKPISNFLKELKLKKIVIFSESKLFGMEYDSVFLLRLFYIYHIYVVTLNSPSSNNLRTLSSKLLLPNP